MTTNLIDAIWSAVVALWITGTAVAVVVGLLALLMPHLFIRVNAFLNKHCRILSSEINLDQPRHIEKFFYRNHILFGMALIVVATGMTLYILLREEGLPLYFYPWLNDYWSEFVAQIVTGYFCLTAVVGYLFGFVILMRPSTLKKIEKMSNQWVSTEAAFSWLDESYNSMEVWVVDHPRVFGGLVLLGTLIMVLLVNGFFV